MARVLIITGDNCTPDTEYAWHRMREEKIDVTIAAVRKKFLHAVFHEREGWDTYIEKPWYTIDSDASLDEIDPSQFDALLLPGGRPPAYLRNIEQCQKIVRHFVESNKPIAAIDRGPLILLEAGVQGRRLTGSSVIKPRIAMGGDCTYVEGRDQAVVDGNIVTVTGRPYYHVWIRAFLSVLEERGIFSTKRADSPAMEKTLIRSGDGGLEKARILIIITEGSSSGQLDHAYFRMLEEGFDVTIAAPVKKPTKTVIRQTPPVGDWDASQEMPGNIVDPDALIDEIDPSSFAALILPGGSGPERLRVHKPCIDIVCHFLKNNKPVASICQGGQIIAEALIAAGTKERRRLSGLDAIKADIMAAGCTYTKTRGEAVVDGNIVTAWKRPDLDVWMGAFVSMLRERGIKSS